MCSVRPGRERVLTQFQAIPKDDLEYLLDKLDALNVPLYQLFGGKASGGGTGKVAPKYRNPANPEQTWTGRGKRPRWFSEALAKGRKESDLRI